MSHHGGPEKRALRTLLATMRGTPFEDIEYCALKVEDAALLAQLLTQERISLAGRVDPALYRALIEDALGGRGPHIMVVKVCGKIVGWSIGLINSRRYWISFLGKHPGMGVKILIGLCRQHCRNRNEVHRACSCGRENETGIEALPKAKDGEWGRRGSDTVRIVDITILPSSRGAGLGARLQVHHLNALFRLGVRRAEAYVRADKIGWLLFYARIGFKISGKKATSLLIVKDFEHSLGENF
jgi:ribosomal protein S18 acetylase RimI-like enzyme